MSTKQEPEHLSTRPHWSCRACGSPWPCPAARADLLSEYAAFPSLLKIYLSTQMYEALDDLTTDGNSPPPNLYERFIAWTRSHPHY